VGVFSLLIAGSLKMKTYAFEPTPEIAKFLEDVIREYCLPITVKGIALSDESGTAEFFLSTRSDASNTLNESFRPGSPSIKVPMDTLDAVVAEKPALIKIDVETAEPKVLAGAARTIDAHRPFLIVEVLNPRIGKQVNAFFAGRSYTAYHITSKQRWRPHPEVPAEFVAKERNWLFAPEPLTRRFWVRLDAWRWRLWHG
jgi:FkbM family methyltransferase